MKFNYHRACKQATRIMQRNHGVNQAKRRNGGSRKRNNKRYGLLSKAEGFRR